MTMMPVRRLVTPLALGLLLAALPACATVGRGGKLGFSYLVEDELLSVGAAGNRIARGGKVTLLVPVSVKQDPRRPVKPGTLVPAVRTGELRVYSARSADPHVIAVARVARDRVVLAGRGVGSSEVTVETSRGVDSIRLGVAAVHRVELSHLAGKLLLKDGFPRGAALLAGGAARLAVERYAGDGARLVGHGLAPAIKVEPAQGAVILAGPLDERHVDLQPSGPGELTLKPLNGTPLRLRVVEAHQVHTLELVGWDLSAGPRPLPRVVSRERGMLFFPRATLADGTLVLGLDGVIQLRSLTPHSCSLVSMARWMGDGVHGLKVEASGVCHVQAKLGAHTRELVLQVLKSRPVSSIRQR
jgi:hypothetical protein